MGGKLEAGPISWEAAAAISPEYAEVLETEELGHELRVDEYGTIRWVANPVKEQRMMDMFDAKDLNDLFMKGADKNDPRIRELYKHMGYSLFGFWEIFYWEVNNEIAYQYMGRKEGNKRRIRFSVVVEMDKDVDEERVLDYISESLDLGIEAAEENEDFVYEIVSIIEDE